MICRSCQYAYPRDSETCPQCGRRNPGTPTVRRLRLVAVCVALVAAAFLYYLWSKHDQFSGSGNPSFPTGTTTTPPEGSPTSGPRFK